MKTGSFQEMENWMTFSISKFSLMEQNFFNLSWTRPIYSFSMKHINYCIYNKCHYSHFCLRKDNFFEVFFVYLIRFTFVKQNQDFLT